MAATWDHNFEIDRVSDLRMKSQRRQKMKLIKCINILKTRVKYTYAHGVKRKWNAVNHVCQDSAEMVKN